MSPIPPKNEAWATRRFRLLLHGLARRIFQQRDEHRLGEIFQGSLKNLKEPSITKTLDMATDYLHPSFEGEAILSMGKSRDFVTREPPAW